MNRYRVHTIQKPMLQPRTFVVRAMTAQDAWFMLEKRLEHETFALETHPFTSSGFVQIDRFPAFELRSIEALPWGGKR